MFVVLGAQQRRRRTYQAWREGGRLPQVVIELTSKKTRQADQTSKPQLYARLGVLEYFVFDPFDEYLQPPLQGFRLVNGTYQRMVEFPLQSRVLGLELREEEMTLRLARATEAEAELAGTRAESEHLRAPGNPLSS